MSAWPPLASPETRGPDSPASGRCSAGELGSTVPVFDDLEQSFSGGGRLMLVDVSLRATLPERSSVFILYAEHTMVWFDLHRFGCSYALL